MGAAEPPKKLHRSLTSRRAVADDQGVEVVKAGCFTRNVMKCPCVVMWVSFATAIVLAAVPIVTGTVELKSTGFAGTDTDTISEGVHYYAWREVEEDKYYPSRRRLGTTPEAKAGLSGLGFGIFSARGLGVEAAAPSRHAGRGVQQRRLQARSAGVDSGDGDLPIHLYYEGLNSDENMFVADSITSMAALETELLEVDGWAAHCSNATNPLTGETRCASPLTVLRYLYPNDALEREQCEAGFCAALLHGVNLTDCDTYGYGVFPCTSTIYDWRDGALAAEADWPTLLSTRLCDNQYMGSARSTLLATEAVCGVGGLSSRYVRSVYNVYTDGEWQDYADDNEDWLKVLADALDDAKEQYSATGPDDFELKTSGAPINMWWEAYWSGYPEFTKLLSADLFKAIFSFMVIFAIVLLNTGSLLLTLAGLFEIIISLALAMFLWMLCGQDQVSTFEMLGLFLILCIGADDIFVFTDTWKESAAMPPAISGSLQTRFTWTYNRAASAMLATTVTTAFCLLLNATSPFPMLKTFGIFNAFIVLCDYTLVITWYACTTVCLARLAATSCPPGQNWECSCCCRGKEESEIQERAVTAWFRDKFAPCLHKLRWGLIVLTVGLLAGGVAVVAVMYDDGQEEVWVKGHQFRILGEVKEDEFGPAEDSKFTVKYLYGMDDPACKYPTSSNLFQADKDGYDDDFEVKYLASYDFGPEAQQKMVADCETVAANSEIVANQEAYCVLNDLKEAVGAAFPYADEAALRSALEAFYASDRYAQLTALYGSTNYAENTGFVAEGDAGISAIFHGFNATMPTTVTISASSLREYYDPWRSTTDALCDDSVAPCIMAQGMWYYMATLQGLADSAIQNIVIALAISYFVLVVVTGNVFVPVIAVVSIGATVTWVLATAFLLGHKMGSNVGLLIVMIVGMAVDYAVHLTHFYNEASGSRYEKAQAALHGVGFSVVGGALTTGGAALPLVTVQNFVFFVQAGHFILFTAIWGLVFSFLMLLPMLMVCGPEHETGDVRNIIRRFRGQRAPPPTTKVTTSSRQAESHPSA